MLLCGHITFVCTDTAMFGRLCSVTAAELVAGVCLEVASCDRACARCQGVWHCVTTLQRQF